MRRSVSDSFCWLARSVAHPEWGPALRLHYYSDCPQITGNGCQPVPVHEVANDGERPLCWTCVGRLVEVAEAVSA
jgi:hypothetical protein